uniref:NBS-LRR type resistance protein n=1 Tax=Cucumis melo TaxID=3656 RepID=A0A9I9EMI5_CUCME
MISTFNMSNHGRTRLLDRSSLTIITAGQSRFYNDNTSSLRKRGVARPCRVVSENTRSSRDVRITGRTGCACKTKCWNSSPSLPQRVVSHSLRMRYAIRHRWI